MARKMKRASSRVSLGRRGRAPLKMSTRRSVKAPARKPAVGGMTVREAGRKGGLIGGKKGGETVKAERGAGFYEQIGKKGGETVKAERGTPFYEEIGKKGGHKVRSLIEEGKKAALEANKVPSEGTAVTTEAKPPDE